MATLGTDDGATLYWEEGGAGSPLLLIQGLGFSADMWYRLLPALEKAHRVIRYDGRGIGRSSVPPGPYSIERMAADALSVLDAAGADRTHVFGCSLGGIVAQEVALGAPDRLLSLTLCCTHPGGDGTIWPAESVMDMLRNRPTDPEASIRASIPVGYAAGTDPARIEEDVRRRLALPTSAEGYAGQLMGGLGYAGTLHRLPDLDVPVLVITGDEDQMVPPENAKVLAGAIKDARLVVVPGAGHVLFTDAPEALTSAMLSFYEEVAGAHDRSR